MMHADRSHVLQRLRELHDWAEYIGLSVSEDQGYESGKLQLLEQLLGRGPLEEIRLASRRLSELLIQGVHSLESGPGTAQAA